jgi:hypothetical protein
MDATRSKTALHVRRFAARLRSESGFAVITVLMMILAAFAVVSVGVITTVRVQGGTVRDERTKAALQLAQTAMNRAMLQYNRIDKSDANPCLPVTPLSGPGAGGWCNAVGPVTDTNGGTFSYVVKPYDDGINKVIEVVATGQFDNATRRIYTKAKALGQNAFFDAQVKTSDGVQLDQNAKVHASLSTNGNLVLNSNAKQCGQATVGIGKTMTVTGNAGYWSDTACTQPYSTVINQQVILPRVNQGDVVTSNDNWRFFGSDLVSGNKANVCWDGRDANGLPSALCGPRQLWIGGNSAVTLTGSRYSVCKLTMRSNAAMYVVAGHPASMFFDSPEACGYTTQPAVQLDMDSNTRISSTTGSPANVALMFTGSTTFSSRILLRSNTVAGTACQQNYVIYAPLTDLELNSNSTYCGALGGKTLHLDQNADLQTPVNPFELVLPPTAPHYTNESFIECSAVSPPTGGTPTTGC